MICGMADSKSTVLQYMCYLQCSMLALMNNINFLLAKSQKKKKTNKLITVTEFGNLIVLVNRDLPSFNLIHYLMPVYCNYLLWARIILR